MKLTRLEAGQFREMILAGGQQLKENVDLINALNVFPVPDGDTGTNMNMSFQSGIEGMADVDQSSIGSLAAGLAKGLLMGARGNSGVILSQIFRGFSKALTDKLSVTAKEFAAAFTSAVDSAYKAVMKPVEGTILTVVRESAAMGEKKADNSDDIIEVMEAIVEGGRISLDKTPDLLPVLKQVGVVDSGGKGLLCIYEGFLSALTGERIVSDQAEQVDSQQGQHAHAIFESTNEHPMSMEDITYGFCTEIMVRLGEGPTVVDEFDYEDFRNTLDSRGDSLLVVADDEVVKVHIHTEDPGEIMQLGQRYGELIKIKVDNMREQVRDLERQEGQLQASQTQPVAVASEEVPAKDIAMIAVAAGQGVADLFKSAGCDYVLEGGQTMNPSTEDFIKAIDSLNAKQVIILPNNKNIQMAAEQAKSVADLPVEVVPTRSIPQGLTAVLSYNPHQTLEENSQAMTDMLSEVKSGQITYAIRDTEIDGLHIKKNDYMGLLDGDIIVSDPTMAETFNLLMAEMVDDDSEIVTILIGEDGNEDLADTVSKALMTQYPLLEIEIFQGDQPVYPYIIAVE